ncbi:MAG: glycosyltransferase [Aliarcobacter butzleri]|nr:glycosyltransferase [Aliarcobacter butzleri]
MKFSVLMSVYNKEKPEYLDRAMKSIWDEQNIKPNEIILVQDGKLTDDLYNTIDEWKNKLSDILKIIPLEQNLGLGDALNIGMKYCSYEIIARMDTDDISLPNRFQKQLEVFENNDIDICGAWISEFDKDEKEILGFRKLPQYNEDIIKYSKTRCPINHPAVMYKKSIVEKAGGYKHMLLMEDYYLWARMLLSGAKFYNIQEPLVNMRAGYGQLERRGGFKYAIEEFKFLNKLKKIGYLTTIEYLKNILIKVPIRLLPKELLKSVYGLLRSKN